MRRIRATRRAWGLSNWSDRELREAVGGLNDGSSASNFIPEDTLVRVFAVVDETIRRRLGLWNVFDLPDADDEPSMAAARRELTATGRGRYPGSDLLLPAEFYRAARRRLDHEREGRHFRPTDQQLLAGLHLCNRRIVEVAAGEGKTVAAAFPSALYALLGHTVHVVTANDYLAARDCERLAPVYRALGLRVGAVLDHMAGPERRESYANRIIYGTLREFAFDYLRDQLVMSPDDQIQGPLDVAIIDEADQTLLDEAVTPLVIAGAPIVSRRAIVRADRAVRGLVAEQAQLAAECRRQLEQSVQDGQANDKLAILLARAMLAQPDDESTRQLAASQPRLRRRALSLIDTDGSGRPHPEVGEGLYCLIYIPLTLPTAATKNGSRRAVQRANLVNQVHQLLRAHLLLRRGVDYVVGDDQIVLVDRDTGRPRPDTHYQDGLHPAVEAKEGVTVHPDRRSLGEISVPGFARRYRSLAGLTGTAQAASDEFRRLYGLDVEVVPDTRHTRRRDLPSRVYAQADDQLNAVVDEVRHCQRSGRPTLVATRTVAQSEAVSRRLTVAGIPHSLLNAATGHEEVDIVRVAGQPVAVTVATNMAGRGTDVMLPPDLDRFILVRFAALLEELLVTDPDGRAVGVKANTPAEANLLAQALVANPRMSAARAGQGGRLAVHLRGTDPAPPLAVTLEFGLGLHVVSTEFNDSPRVGTATAGPERTPGCFRLHSQPAGQLRRRRDAAQREASGARALLLEYAAVLDRHADDYYLARQDTLVAEPDRLRQWADDAARFATTGLAGRHFPGLVADDYARRFAALAAELWVRYGVDAEPAWGHSLDALEGALAELLQQRLAERQDQLGSARFAELSRLLLLQAGDELWENHRADLRGMAAVSRMETHLPKTVIAEYVISADAAWQRFREEVSDSFLSQICHFPIAGLPIPPENGPAPSSPLVVDPRLAQLTF
ncbi:Protein translocase subunit SecA [Geodia barretti]|uniref:Protein translocase subunit SecA n=1 Tax=Geodia barretti TaxID=519541 RepID=A0AA35RYD3_GEOBA|nr:Protein translocase subunit SecA [Geodia barretti]